MRADPCFAPDAWVTTWDSHNPGVLALVRKRGEETLVGLFNLPSTRQGPVWTLWVASITPRRALPSGWRMWSWNPIRRCW